ncbi:MAG: hypothetical protein CMJ64_02545 [Planctomycetaceae bacterium]|jgi:hypothetical protein|nr:hypothetical protein [Planctomycetaceae bacterium]
MPTILVALGGALVFEGTGPTVSLEGSRDVGCRGLYFVGNFRASMLFGEVTFDGTLDADDDLATVLENQLGIGWRREMARADLNVRALWESQFWLNETIATDTGSNLGKC